MFYRPLPDGAGPGPGPARPSLSRPRATPVQPRQPVKIVIAGGFGVGKTTVVSAVSEIPVLSTEAAMTTAAVGVDDADPVPNKTTTTVALDFGRITIDAGLTLYLFGTPGQDRFGFLWDDITRGALGALVIVDTRRAVDCYPAIDYFEHCEVPFVVGVNKFDGNLTHDLDEVRWALDIAPETPLLTFDARNPRSVRDALLTVLECTLARATSAAGRYSRPTPSPTN